MRLKGSKNQKKMLMALLCWPVFLFSGLASAAYDLNLMQGVTDASQSAYDLHMIILWICVVIGVLVFGIMFYSIFAFRKSKGAVAAQFHESTFIEILWTVIPFVILVVMAIPATVALIDLEREVTDADITVQVTAYQWKWKYEYLEEGVSFFSSLAPTSRDVIKGDPTTVENYLLEVDHPVVLPVNKNIRFLITSDDVIHSWWVPDLGWKQDALPGFINTGWTNIKKPGTYRGQCTELCGKDHGFMPIVVEATTDEEFAAWVVAQKENQAADAAGANKVWSMEDLMAKGEQVYNVTCVACHQANGQGLPPAFPAIAGSPITTGPVDAHIEIVVHGKAGSAMQAFGAQLGDADLAAVITYERNAFGNSVGDMVQPADIKAARR